jgi:hypothetical protein
VEKEGSLRMWVPARKRLSTEPSSKALPNSPTTMVMVQSGDPTPTQLIKDEMMFVEGLPQTEVPANICGCLVAFLDCIPPLLRLVTNDVTLVGFLSHR